MVNLKTRNLYTPTIGIECHVQLRTKTKLFAAVSNDAREAPVNSLISHICLGMPGALPVLNEQAIVLASKAAFALATEPQKFSKFDRKHYFYPDLPKGYQITQYDEPIILGGHVDMLVGGKSMTVRITRAHLEEDAGKSSHPAGKDYSLVDLNRAGTPLLEIVSEPDMHTSEAAKAYARELWLLMRYADVSDADMYYGNMRFDVNVSVSKSETLGTRTETKNLNSFRSVEKAVDYEISRQIEVLEKGETIQQETRGWDDAKQRTFSQRNKEDAHDYRYFPDPDLPPIVLTDEIIEALRNDIPILPNQLRGKLQDLQLDTSAIETLVEHLPAGRFILAALDSGCNSDTVKRMANWLTSEVQAIVGNSGLNWEEVKLDVDSWRKLSELTAEGKLSSTNAKIVLGELVQNGGDPAEIAAEKKLLQLSSAEEIEKIVQQVMTDNPAAAEDVRNGQMKAIGFLVGQVMKASKGQANPSLAQELIKKHLE